VITTVVLENTVAVATEAETTPAAVEEDMVADMEIDDDTIMGTLV